MTRKTQSKPKRGGHSGDLGKATLALLRKIPMFVGVRVQDLRKILKPENVRRVGPKELVFEQGDPADCMFIVIRGRIRIFIHSGPDRRKTVAYLERGDFFGEMALFSGENRSAAAQAVDDVTMLSVGKRNYSELLKRNWPMAEFVLKALCERLNRTNEQVENLLSQNILGRVAKTLSRMARHEGVAEGGGILIAAAYTHQEIADMVGTTREPIARAISSLKQAKLLEVRNGRFFIPDPERLNRLGLSSV
jgi:CRP-like cAMP-binding protein